MWAEHETRSFMTEASLGCFLLFSHLIGKYEASQQCFQLGEVGDSIVTSLMRTTALHRSTYHLSLGKAKAPPGAGTHQKLGPRSSCLLQSKMLLIRSSLGNLLRLCPEELGRPLTLIWQSLFKTTILSEFLQIFLSSLKCRKDWNFIYLFIYFKYAYWMPLYFVCVEQSGGLQDLKLQVF